MKDKVITALDLTTVEEAEALVALLGDEGVAYKIGYQLFPLGGYALARRLVERGKQVFIDAKLLDIGSTVEKGVRSLTKIGAHLLTVHADGDAIRGAVEGRGDSHLKILAVTVLTSWDQEAVTSHGITDSVPDLVLRRAELALKSGADGLIASAQEAPVLRERFGSEPLIITPGIRPAGSAAGDQKRIVTPSEAIANGASALVIGRPITAAESPRGALTKIYEELEGTA
ncbi:orotidine-5'-phosphate decarboxylase [Parvularcula sp. ZS-1/3]|uniref:Orotidine 5'-phosphate decarboxylase n=1 Tax=Parvularcula mediterranea TaxID=2732508 RepID=A0A7Y3RKR3_9PROT|nr:orotidine-5'-phosphate decarboxylase [Parvularcula mediterranea]NNU15859.1 orotidine-5'-phosphate decarboxylase [Parvularcula mediterranea]